MGVAASAPGMNRALLWLAALAVMFAAADTYVVVLSLPDMMSSVGLSVEQLQRAAPIISGFLLGYVAMLPLIGRIADLRGRVPVLIAALVIFAFGSLVTAVAYDLDSLVAGRFLQGLGGGGLQRFDGCGAERSRRWDSCFGLEHSYVHGGSVRGSLPSRYRQWMTHKLATWIDQFGSSGCVGCGRCITWCPVGIDITEAVWALRESEGETRREKTQLTGV